MSQVFERFERRVAELERTLEGYREFAVGLAQRLTAQSGPGADRLAERIRVASAPLQFRRLLAELGASAPVTIGGAEAKRVDGLLEPLAKGVVLLGDHDDPMILKLEELVRVGFDALTSEEMNDLEASIERFFVGKREEFSVIGGEREELKKLVASLVEHLHSLRNVNTTFQSKIDTYIGDMEATVNVDDVQILKEAAIREMRGAQVASRNMTRSVDETGLRLETAHKRIVKLEAALEQAKKARWIDALTGLFNRGFFDRAVAASVDQAGGAGKPLSLLMFDIDHFKKINDTYGHRAGDQILRAVARLASEAVRPGDILCRYGGEEFVVIAPNTSLRDGGVLAEKVRASIREHEFVHKNNVLSVTVSIGVAELSAQGETVERLVERSDQALYSAKAKGRDQVVTTT